MLTYSDALVNLVAAANMAGYLEAGGVICVPSDEALTEELIALCNEFDALNATINYDLGFFDFMRRRLIGKFSNKI